MHVVSPLAPTTDLAVSWVSWLEQLLTEAASLATTAYRGCEFQVLDGALCPTACHSKHRWSDQEVFQVFRLLPCSVVCSKFGFSNSKLLPNFRIATRCIWSHHSFFLTWKTDYGTVCYKLDYIGQHIQSL